MTSLMIALLLVQIVAVVWLKRTGIEVAARLENLRRNPDLHKMKEHKVMQMNSKTEMAALHGSR